MWIEMARGMLFNHDLLKGTKVFSIHMRHYPFFIYLAFSLICYDPIESALFDIDSQEHGAQFFECLDIRPNDPNYPATVKMKVLSKASSKIAFLLYKSSEAEYYNLPPFAEQASICDPDGYSRGECSESNTVILPMLPLDSSLRLHYSNGSESIAGIDMTVSGSGRYCLGAVSVLPVNGTLGWASFQGYDYSFQARLSYLLSSSNIFMAAMYICLAIGWSDYLLRRREYEVIFYVHSLPLVICAMNALYFVFYGLYLVPFNDYDLQYLDASLLLYPFLYIPWSLLLNLIIGSRLPSRRPHLLHYLVSVIPLTVIILILRPPLTNRSIFEDIALSFVSFYLYSLLAVAEAMYCLVRVIQSTSYRRTILRWMTYFSYAVSINLLSFFFIIPSPYGLSQRFDEKELSGFIRAILALVGALPYFIGMLWMMRLIIYEIRILSPSRENEWSE